MQNLEKEPQKRDASNITENPELVEQLIRLGVIEQTCFNCVWFIVREEKPQNRVCRYPDKLGWEGMKCLCWEWQPDPKKRGKYLTNMPKEGEVK